MDKIRIDHNWVNENSNKYRLTYTGDLTAYQKNRIGMVCIKEIDKFFEGLDRDNWIIKDFSYLPLLNLNENYVFNENLSDTDITLAKLILKRFVEDYWKPMIRKTDDISELSFYAVILIPTQEGFQLFDDVESAFIAYKKMYSMIGENNIKEKDVREMIMQYFKKQEHIFVSDLFEKNIASEEDKKFKKLILPVIRKMRTEQIPFSLLIS